MIPGISELDDGRQQFTSYDDFVFDSGGVINPLVLAYDCYGELNAKKDNAILVHHALSTSSHLTSTDKNPAKGWWQEMVGPGRHLDTDQYFVICINNLGSCYGSAGPVSINPATKQQYRNEFPRVTINDMVRSQKILIETLGIKKLHAILGNSMGAMLSIAWIALYPNDAEFLISISSCAQAYPANNANRFLQRDIIKLDAAWNEGNYTFSGNLKGFKTARKLGLLTYRNWTEINNRFVNKAGRESIEHYLDYNAEKFVDNFDCNSYLALLDAMNTFNLADESGTLTEALQGISAKSMIVSVDSDILFTPSQQQALHDGLKEAGNTVTYIDHQSIYGHDAFLVETEAFGKYIRDFIGLSKP
jgi:homoserine O-acetyltransferase